MALHIAKACGLVVVGAIVLYNFLMYLAIYSSKNTSGNMEEFAKHIGVPSLTAAAVLFYFCH